MQILQGQALTGSAGLVLAQVINVDTKMNILGNVKCSVSLWRAMIKKNKSTHQHFTLYGRELTRANESCKYGGVT